ncbi:MAG: hypothetical protein SVT52_07005 [Planctomycetota bacterium]|nr:hypothetical protein [Planctomycetota bacterium]
MRKTGRPSGTGSFRFACVAFFVLIAAGWAMADDPCPPPAGHNVLFAETFDSEKPSATWLGDVASVRLEQGIAVINGNIRHKLDKELYDWVLDLRVRFANKENGQPGLIKLLNSDPKYSVYVSTFDRMFRLHAGLRESPSYLGGGSVLGHTNDEKFHTIRISFVKGILSWYMDGALLYEQTDLDAGSNAWPGIEILADASQPPIQLDWIRLSAPEAQSPWPKRPTKEQRREFWKNLIDEMWQRIEDKKNAIDWEKHPVYGTKITKSAESIEIRRATVQMRFAPKNCSIEWCRLRDVVFEALSLPDLVMVDEAGKVYRQSLATDGGLEVQDAKDGVFIRGKFTPKATDGASAPAAVEIVYELRKMSGQIFVDYTIRPSGEIPAKFRRITVDASLGRAGRQLETLFVDYYWDYFEKRFHGPPKDVPQRDVCPTPDRRIFNGPTNYITWTDGKVGIQIVHAGGPYKQMPVLDEVRKDKTQLSFLTAEISKGRKHILYTPWNMGRNQPKVLDVPFKVSIALGLFPPREYRPKCFTFWDRSFSLPMFVDRHAWHGQTEQYIRRNAEQGVDFATISLGMYSQWIPHPSMYRRFVRTMQKYGMNVIYYTEGSGRSTDKVVEDGMMTMDQFKSAHHVLPQDSPWMAGETLSDMRLSNNRLLQLASLYNCLKNFDVDGLYVDSYRSDAWPGGPSRLRGAAIFTENARLLLDSFEEPKYFLGHNWVEVIPALQGVVDFTYPGEHRMSGQRGRLNRSEEQISYNSLLAGVQVIPLDLGTYNFESPAILHQFYANCVGGIINYYPWMRADLKAGRAALYRSTKEWITHEFTPAELKNARKYFEPLAVFKPDVAHHPVHHDYGRFVSACPPDVTAIVYERKGDDRWLVTVSCPKQTQKCVDIKLNMEAFPGKAPEKVFVYDLTDKKIIPAKLQPQTGPPETGKTGNVLHIADLPLAMPKALLVMCEPEAAKIIFHSRTVRKIVERQLNGRTLKVKLQGVPSCKAKVWVCCRNDKGPYRIIEHAFKFPESGETEINIDCAAKSHIGDSHE